MAIQAPNSKRPAFLKLSFRDDKNPNAKPPMSEAEARRLVTAIDEGKWREGVVVAEQGCTYEGCGQKVEGLKGLIASFGVSVACRYSCEWFYSQGGGWQHVCYANCSGKGVSIEAVLD
jgi:hypothetical protein